MSITQNQNCPAVPGNGIRPAIIREYGLTDAQAVVYGRVLEARKAGSNVAPKEMDAMLRLKTGTSEYARNVRALAGVYLYDKTDSCRHFAEKKNETLWGGAIAYARYAAHKYASNTGMSLPDAIDALIDRQAESRKTYDALNMAYITRNPSMSTLSRTVNAINYVNGTDDIVDADAIVRDMYANARDERKRNTYSGTRAIADTIADYSPTTPDIADAVISALDGAVDIDKWAQLDNMWATYTSKLYRKGLAKLADYGRADYDSIPTGIRQAHDSLVFKFNKTFGVSLSRFEFHTLCKHFYNADNADKGGK